MRRAAGPSLPDQAPHQVGAPAWSGGAAESSGSSRSRPAEDPLRAEIRQWRASAAVVAGCVVMDIFGAVLWAQIAPGEQFKVFKDGTSVPLPTESTHQYASIAIFTLIAVVMGTVVAVAAWSCRSVRGTVMLLTVGFGDAVGALTAYLLGRVLAGGVDPSSVGPTSSDSLVQAGPTLGSALIVAIQPGIAVAIYTFLVAWNGQPDLGRGDSASPRSPGASADPARNSAGPSRDSAADVRYSGDPTAADGAITGPILLAPDYR